MTTPARAPRHLAEPTLEALALEAAAEIATRDAPGRRWYPARAYMRRRTVRRVKARIYGPRTPAAVHAARGHGMYCPDGALCG
jgi:hypothetical protein